MSPPFFCAILGRVFFMGGVACRGAQNTNYLNLQPLCGCASEWIIVNLMHRVDVIRVLCGRFFGAGTLHPWVTRSLTHG